MVLITSRQLPEWAWVQFIGLSGNLWLIWDLFMGQEGEVYCFMCDQFVRYRDIYQ